MPVIEPETPYELAEAAHARQDPMQAGQLVEEFSRSARRATIATQLAALAYLVAKLEQRAPLPDLVVPAITLMVRQSATAIQLLDATPAGRA